MDLPHYFDVCCIFKPFHKSSYQFLISLQHFCWAFSKSHFEIDKEGRRKKKKNEENVTDLKVTISIWKGRQKYKETSISQICHNVAVYHLISS